MKKTLITICDVLCILLTLFAILGIVTYIYIKYFGPKTYTEDVAYLNTLDTTDGKKQIFEVNYYANRDNSGIEMLELKTNYYTDSSKEEVYSLGIQYTDSIKIGSTTTGVYLFSGALCSEVQEDAPAGSCYTYNFDNNSGTAYSATRELSKDDYFTISIDDKAYKLNFSKKKSADSNFIITSYFQNTIHTLGKAIYKSVKEQAVGEIVLEYQFKDLFDLYEEDNGKWVQVNDADTFYSYCYINVKIHNEGAKTYNDSMFKIVKGDSNWINEGASVTKEYVSDKAFYVLTENDFKFTYNETLGYHTATLRETCFNYVKAQGIQNFKVIIDKDTLTELGVIFNKLESTYLSDLGIKTYTLVSNGVETEVVL